MSRALILAAAVVILLSATQGALAFSTRPGRSGDCKRPAGRPGRTRRQDVERAIRRNYLRGTRGTHDAAVFGTAIGRQHEQPICHEPEYGLRAERTSVVGRFPGALVTDESPRERGAHEADPWEALAAVLGVPAEDNLGEGPPRVGEALPAPDPEADLYGDCGERPGWVGSRLSPGPDDEVTLALLPAPRSRACPASTRPKTATKIQRQVLQLAPRRSAAYRHVADLTRWKRKPSSQRKGTAA